ncbi:MAG: hypothetical protein N3J91_14105 [Verrucomicrobiae bacterium]|nr:hypothetical protein [Verrucomicrobiae bacterium]
MMLRLVKGHLQCLMGGLLFALLIPSLLAASPRLKQFDVFVGYDNVAVTGAWVPLTFEMLNEGPTLKGMLEIHPAQKQGGTIRRVPLELPTGTRKRLCVPVFVDTYYNQTWDVFLRDEDGRTLEQCPDVRPKLLVSDETVVLGTLPKSVGGMPLLPEVNRNFSRFQPLTARLTPELFPDHPLALEGLTALYLNAEKALELREAQVRSLLAWVQQGGHLLIGLHSPAEAKAVPWLARLLPVQPEGMEKTVFLPALLDWTRTSHQRIYSPAGHLLAVQPGFEQVARREDSPTPPPGALVTGEVVEGRVLAAHEGRPLIVSTQRGRGLVTVLLFAPELEPFRSWEHRRYFFAKLLELPPHFFDTKPPPSQASHYFYRGFIDGLMGLITDSRQIRQLPLGWIMVLLLGYLTVIGPVDYFLLRKLKRPMLTWITFPAYVVMFSALIYWVGYKLRAGQREWNEMHVADIHPRDQGGALIRGWNFIGTYAPANLSYPLASTAPAASLRHEYRLYGGPSLWSQKRSDVVHQGDSFKGSVDVPVWTSQMYVEEYYQPLRQAPITATLVSDHGPLKVQVRNHLDRPLALVTILSEAGVASLPDLNPGQTAVIPLTNQTSFLHFLTNTLAPLWSAASLDRSADLNPDTQPMQPEDWLKWTMAASLVRTLERRTDQSAVLSTPMFDLGLCLKRGNVVLFAAVADHLPKAPLPTQMQEFQKGFRHTVYRLVLPPPANPLSPPGNPPATSRPVSQAGPAGGKPVP